MKLIIFLFFLLCFSVKAEDMHDYTIFFETKNNIKEKLVEIIKLNYDSEITTQNQVKITNKLKDGLNNLILEGNKFLFTLVSKVDEEKAMFFTILAKYEDDSGIILWEFDIICTPNNILFFSRLADSPSVSMDDYYNWMKLEKG